MNTRNKSAGSFDSKFICNHPFPMVADKREIEYENKSTALDIDREKLLYRDKEIIY